MSYREPTREDRQRWLAITFECPTCGADDWWCDPRTMGRVCNRCRPAPIAERRKWAKWAAMQAQGALGLEGEEEKRAP